MIEYKICAKTIMDTSDPLIEFDQYGVSHHVRKYNTLIKQRVPDQKQAKIILDKIVKRIKLVGENKDYDCIIGVSGGVDSTYVAYLVKKLGLRPLAIHFDNGWNSELAVSNIEKTLNKLNIDLFTYVVDWEEFKNLQIAFLKASVPDGEIPTDHAIYAVLHRIASKYHIKYIISGSNIKTEGILSEAWSYGHLDRKYIKAINKKFGTIGLKSYPSVSLFSLFYYIYIKRIKTISILDLIEYNKKQAISILSNELGWVDYGGKHYESVYTRFFQGYVLPRKFNIDKRRGHLSTLICSGEITRNEALELIKISPYPSEEMQRQDLEFVLKKFEISIEQFNAIMGSPLKSFRDYPNQYKLIGRLRKLYTFMKK
jgi:N-acetyl sugar amidotransferase